MKGYLKRRALRGAAVLLALTGGWATAGAGTAMAGAEYYCFGAGLTSTYYQLGTCAGERHSLNSNRVWSYYGTSHDVGAWAKDTNGNYYANYVTGSGYACHPYSGANLLYPTAVNPVIPSTPGATDTVTVYGIQYYGADRWC